MHFFVIQQHQILINQMIIVVNPIEIIVIIEMTMFIIINHHHHLDIVRNHVNIVINFKTNFLFLFQQFWTICFCFVSFVSFLLYDYFLLFLYKREKTPVFISFFSLFVCMYNTKRGRRIIICVGVSVFDFFFVSHFCFYVFTLHIQFVLWYMQEKKKIKFIAFVWLSIRKESSNIYKQE